jgi:uncharacterized membrane protein
MKINRYDILVIFVGVLVTVLGPVMGYHGLSFSGGALVGSFIYRLGYNYGESGD